jgi:hypothetical protein
MSSRVLVMYSVPVTGLLLPRLLMLLCYGSKLGFHDTLYFSQPCVTRPAFVMLLQYTIAKTLFSNMLRMVWPNVGQMIISLLQSIFGWCVPK